MITPRCKVHKEPVSECIFCRRWTSAIGAPIPWPKLPTPAELGADFTFEANPVAAVAKGFPRTLPLQDDEPEPLPFGRLYTCVEHCFISDPECKTCQRITAFHKESEAGMVRVHPDFHTACHSGGHTTFTAGCSGCELGLAHDARIITKVADTALSEKLSRLTEYATAALSGLMAHNPADHYGIIIKRAWSTARHMEAERKEVKDAL